MEDSCNFESLASSRSKRTLKDKYGRKAAFERLKELKGAKHKLEIGEVSKVYDEVEEREYAKRRQNRMEDDWIVDDDGSGYVEDGREIFDEDADDDDELFVSKSTKSKSSKGKTKLEGPSKSHGGNLRNMFANMPLKRRKVETNQISDQEKAFIEECLLENQKEEAPRIVPPKIYSNCLEKKKLPFSKPSPMNIIKKTSIITSVSVSEMPKLKEVNGSRIERKLNTENFCNITKETKLNGSINCTERDALLVDKEEDLDMEDFIDDFDGEISSFTDENQDKDVHEKEATVTVPKENGIRDKMDNTGTLFLSNWENFNATVDASSNTIADIQVDISQLPLVDNSEGEKVFRFYWLDAYEEFSRPGVVFLFGKVWYESANIYVSCCLMVKNIERRIFLLPRLKKLNMKTKVEGEDVTMMDVYTEFNEVFAKKYKILQFKSKKSVKKYCFDNVNIPNEADYMEVRYSASYPALPSDLVGETICSVFGTSTSSLELLLLDRKIKGPCWLDIKLPNISNPPVSWCKVEAQVDGYDGISTVSGIAPPPLVVMSISIHTTINKKHQNEINLMGWLAHSKFPIDKGAPSSLFESHNCAISKPSNVIWPLDLKNKLQNFTGTKVKKCESEGELLKFFIAQLTKIDPDVIVGHDIFGFSLTVLLHRMVANNILNTQWSKLGRLKRTQMPKLSNKGYAERAVSCGRLICDAKLSAKELIRSKSYDLAPLVHQVLHIKESEVATLTVEEVKKGFGNGDSVLQLINTAMQDSLFALRIIAELNALPLALQITNIAGNILSRTLLGGRSERNEFLLLHAFEEKNYICPDKQYNKKAVAVIHDDDVEQDVKKGRKKASYAGGLVLEPKKGFYDKYILLMDFNSLYPSIIQEYNICFSTVKPVEKSSDSSEVEVLPDLPDKDAELGVLPTEIRKLVESRREVKKLMNKSDISPELKQQYDVRQKALKLTANSMYGCLGFSHSRFFARHLAALITGRGREILLHTRDLVNRMNFEVIYGDTDSIMINTNSTDFEQVFKLGQKIKVEVNKLYKLLELDVDGVFKYMLLLKKKKYAAVTMCKLPNGEIIEEKEFKGLDIVRRDWSGLSSEAGRHILEDILSDKEADDRLDSIHSYLEMIKEELNDGKIDLDKLTITKQLTKNPTDYPDKQSLPHVQVALRVNSNGGKSLRQGDTVPYIICLDGTNNGPTQRAYHIDEVKGNPELKIDTNYYLAHQVHPVISRLCDPIDGTDSARIAECLGLDPKAYRSSQSSVRDNNEELICSDISEEEKFRLCERFSFKCPSESCQILITFDAPLRGSGSSSEFFLQSCPNPKCKSQPYEYYTFICNTLRLEMRKHINTYYKGWLVCEDASCNNRTRRIPMKFQRGFPICNACEKSIMIREYSEAQLYKQLGFYEYIFDYQKGCQKNKDLRNKSEEVKRAYLRIQNEIQKFLRMNSYSVINLGKIFSNLYVKPSSSRG